MKSVTFENLRNHERVVVEDTRDIQVIDNVEYYKVHKLGEVRTFLMRKEILAKVSDKKSSVAYNK